MKELLKTKSFWVGVAAIATGISMCAAKDYPNGIQMIGGGIATICLRDAVRMNTK